MRVRVPLAAAVLASFLASHVASSASHPRVGLIRSDNVKLYSRPSTHAPILTVLVQQTQVQVLGYSHSWARVSIWASVHGWTPSREIVFRKPWSSVSTYRAPEEQHPVRARAAQSIRSSALITASTVVYGSSGGARTTVLRAGRRVRVSAWRQDAAGKIWYRLEGGWALGDTVRFDTPDPGLARAHGRLLWTAVGGKGMWLTLGTIADSDPEAVVRAASRNGISHLYLEAAISPLGFHGKGSVGKLLDAAHRHHITVIAWVYPYLDDCAADVDLTRQVAAFRTPSGQRFDGIAADLERNVQLWTVRAYSQLVRVYLGAGYLLVGVTYPPQSFPDYPFAEVARLYNVIAPMDYWHQTQTAFGLDYGHMPYGYAYAYRYASDSVTSIRRVSGHVPVSPIGQTFDNFGRLEMGPYAPSAQEIRGFLAGSKAAGSIGASFFQWMTAALEEWRAIQSFHF